MRSGIGENRPQSGSSLVEALSSGDLHIPVTQSTSDKSLHRIVIVGGGAAGLELATRLGRRLGKRKRASITLLDKHRTHVWKPLLHEVAAGTLDDHAEAVEFMAQARSHHFRYRIGTMTGLDRAKHHVLVAPSMDESGREIIPRRIIEYDTLIISVGSIVNYFNTPGAADYAIALDSEDQAARFNRYLVDACLRANAQYGPLLPGQLHCVIVGAGATGVELAAELHKSMRDLASFGLDHVDLTKQIKLVIVEAGPCILPALPEQLSNSVARFLADLGVTIRIGRRVTSVAEDGVLLDGGEFLPAELVVWSAGIKAPDFLTGLDGLETDRINRLVVHDTLQTTRDESIFACGDCAACLLPGEKAPVPPRAQAAHEEASMLARSMVNRLTGKPLPHFVYRDFGSLVSLGEYTAMGYLMSGFGGRSLKVHGLIARMMYHSLYKMHRVALDGYIRTGLGTMAELLTRRSAPRVKLH